MTTTIVIDPGHGGYDNGATFLDRKEKDEVLDLALAVGRLLEQAGYRVVYTRTTDEYHSPYQKAMIGNQAEGDFFVSLHRNSSVWPNTYSGVETLVYAENPVTGKLADSINQQLANVGFENLGIEERPNLAVLRRTKMPAVLVEVGFINTDTDNELFDEKFDEIAQAIATGIQQGITDYERERGYGVQVGLFEYYANAENLKSKIERLGKIAKITKNGPYYAVVAGNERNLEGAVILQDELRRAGFDTLVVNL